MCLYPKSHWWHTHKPTKIPLAADSKVDEPNLAKQSTATDVDAQLVGIPIKVAAKLPRRFTPHTFEYLQRHFRSDAKVYNNIHVCVVNFATVLVLSVLHVSDTKFSFRVCAVTVLLLHAHTF